MEHGHHIPDGTDRDKPSKYTINNHKNSKTNNSVELTGNMVLKS